MEDTLRVPGLIDKVKAFAVLILVLMEDTLRELNEREMYHKLSLNPCFNGRYSQS